MTVVSTTTAVWVSAGSAGVGQRVQRRLDASTGLSPGEIGVSDVVIWLSSADVDARARRRQSATEGVAATLSEAGNATHLVLVSSAMVYGAWANNPVPITEDAVLRPDVEFVYARQLGAVEQLADDWRISSPGRTVSVLRPAVAMAADGTSGLAAALAAGMGNASARTIRPRSSCTSTISLPQSCWPPSADSTVCSTWLPMVGLPVNESAPSPVRYHVSSCLIELPR
jgi:hypothetical protein